MFKKFVFIQIHLFFFFYSCHEPQLRNESEQAAAFGRSPAAYLRWRWRGWSDILEPYYTMIWLRVSTSCRCGRASRWPPPPQPPGLLVRGAPQTSAGGVCGKSSGFGIALYGGSGRKDSEKWSRVRRD